MPPLADPDELPLPLANLAATPLGLRSERAINFCVASNGVESDFCVASKEADSIALAGSSRGGLADTASGDGRKTSPIDSGIFVGNDVDSAV